MDPSKTLSLAHRLELRECVVASIAAIEKKFEAADLVSVLAPLLGDTAVHAAFVRLGTRLRSIDHQSIHLLMN